MRCPHCREHMKNDWDDRLYCTSCGLAGTRDVLAAADDIMWSHGSVIVIEYVSGDRAIQATTYAEAYDKLTGGEP